MNTYRNGLPSDVGPMLTTFIRPPLCFSSTPKYSTILSHRAIFLSAPSWKPKNRSGEVISCAPARPGSIRQASERRSARMKLLRVRTHGGRSRSSLLRQRPPHELLQIRVVLYGRRLVNVHHVPRLVVAQRNVVLFDFV